MSLPSPLHTPVYEEMLRRIRTGEWGTGEKMPSEKSLIADFGASRGRVREALAALRAEGMIVGGRGSPPRVHHSAPAQSFDRLMSFTEWAHSLGLTPGHKVIERVRLPASEEIARKLQIAPDDPTVEVIRVRFLGDRPTMLERSVFPHEVGRHLLKGELAHGSINETLARAGVIPLRAKHVIDAVPAHPLEAEQLLIEQWSPLLRVRRITYGTSGQVIEAADSRYLPAMTSFIIENSPEHRAPPARQPTSAG